MKIFESNQGGNRKLNFVGKNNVLVGFSYDTHCCETFGWFIYHEVVKHVNDWQELPVGDADTEGASLENYVFDVEYFREVEMKHDDGSYDTCMAVFRLIQDPNEKAAIARHPRYLHLYNHHNGYYSHGFEMNVGGRNIHEGRI